MTRITDIESYKRNVGRWFDTFSVHVRPWLYELAERYKERGIFAPLPVFTLPSFYSEKMDREIAAIIGACMSDKEDLQNVSALYSMIGPELREWFTDRQFIHYSFAGRNKAVIEWKTLAPLLNRIWEVCSCRTYRVNGGKFTLLTDVEEGIKKMASEQGKSFLETLEGVFQEFYISGRIKARYVTLVLAASDGFSLGGWNIDHREIKTPTEKKFRDFASLWIPGWSSVFSFDEAVSLIGFENDYDFIYAKYAFDEMLKQKPDEIRLLVRRYNSWYKKGIIYKYSFWKKIIPKIEL